MSKIKNATVLITGGANGIGKLMAERCLEQGAKNVVIWDINEPNLEKTVQEFKQKGFGNVSSYLVDVSDLADITWAAQEVLKEMGSIDVLFNNAGIVVGKHFQDHTHKEIDKTLSINVLAVMHITKFFLPAMLAQRQGHIINIASAAGLMPNPKMSVYVGSKYAVVGWSESLRIELEQQKSNVYVTTVTPGYIDTGMFDGVRMHPFIPILKPDFIVDKILEGVKNNATSVREPFMTKTVPILRGILPTKTFDFVAGKLFHVYDSMADFVGRPSKEAMPEKTKLLKNNSKL